jgi:hypothetical protein
MTLFKVLGNPFRWELMLVLADGRRISATELKPILRCPMHILLKNLRILRDAGLLQTQASRLDARFVLYYIPEQWRPRAGSFDFGWCLMDLPKS